MTKQTQLKQQAYASSLKSRALSVLIYLIDRSNQDSTCFPAIPTMAEQLHISESTVKRALKELIEAGYIQKEARFRENNGGQSSNLYTLILLEQNPSENNTNLDHENKMDTQTNINATVKHISFSDIYDGKKEKVIDDVIPTSCTNRLHIKFQNQSCKIGCTPVQKKTIKLSLFYTRCKQEKEENSYFLPLRGYLKKWTGVEVNLQPP